MDDKELFEHVQDLREKLTYHNYRYHVLDDPVVSDGEYDRMLTELRQIEAAHPEWVTADSPTQRAGGEPLDRFEKVTHPAPILSLANAFDAADLHAWYERIGKLDPNVFEADFSVEPKLDGLTVVLHYRDGLFIQGATRGNGEVGEDITANLKTLSTLPLRIPATPDGPQPPPYLVVRGEALMKLADFEAFNQRLSEAGERTYQTPRNTAAGALRQLDPSVTATRPLCLLVYAIVAIEGPAPATQMERLDFLKQLGFPLPENIHHCVNIDEVVSECEGWIEKRETLPYEIDGAVVKINDLALSDRLGVVGKDPRGAIAFKFPAQEVTTDLLDIRVNVGRTGVLTPYAVLEPVEIGGVIVRQATLHNFDFIAEKDIRVGDRVFVKRAGDVIPYVMGPIKDVRGKGVKTYQPPDVCPECGKPVSHIEGEVAWYCVNPACPEQLIRNMEHFVSRSTLDIDGLGIKIVEQLVNEGLVRDVADLYTLKPEDLLALEGFADKKVENLLESIEASKQQPLSRLIYALGIRGVGEVVGADLARYYGGMEALAQTSLEELESIEGIGPNIAQAIVDWFAHDSNQKVLKKLKAAGMWPIVEESEITGPQPFEGLTFVVTGTLPNFSRTEAKEFIESHGGKVTSSVSSRTTYVLVGEGPGAKFTKAQELGINILDEDQLRDLAQNA